MDNDMRRNLARMVEDGETENLTADEIIAASEHYVITGQPAPQPLLAALSAALQKNTAPGWITAAVQYGKAIRIVKYRAKFAAQAAHLLLAKPRK